MQQEQYFKAVPVANPPKKDGYYMLAVERHSELTNEPYTDTYYAYFLEGDWFENEEEARGNENHDTIDIDYYTHWLEPIQLPDAQVLREALEKITVTELNYDCWHIAREALSAGDGWVRVEEGGRLPEDWDTYVWAVRRDNGEVIKISGGNITKYHFAYTHWQPERIPSPPIK